MSKVAAETIVGTTIGGKYKIESLIGEGAMGAVYRAHHVSLQKTVAIKVLHKQLVDQPTFVERFQREAFSASRLDHPNSLRVLDFGQSDGLLYLVMEYVEGDDLLTVMEHEWPLDDRRIVEILTQALAALATAHDMGIVHRDLKPENILLLSGTDDEGKTVDIVKVCDFGIAKLMAVPAGKSQSFTRHLTTDGFVVGTPDYMSPEQARGEEIDGRSDLYSLGVVLYQMLVGELPFSAETPLGVVLRHISDPPPPPSSHNTKVHARLEAICMKALAKDPAARYANAREMRRALRSALTGEELVLASTPAPPVVAHSTDMTSVPVSRPPPPPSSRKRSMFVRLLRELAVPSTRTGRVAAISGAVLGAAVFSYLLRYKALHSMSGQGVVNASGDTVLANPSPPIAETALAPITAPVAPSNVPVRSLPRTIDPMQLPQDNRTSRADTTHNDKSGSNSGSSKATTNSGASDTESPGASGSARGSAKPPTSVAETVPSAPAPEVSTPVAAPSPAPPPPPVAPAPPPAPVVPAVDLARAAVGVGNIATTGGISAGKVRAAIGRIPFTNCYRQSLAGRSAAAPLETTLRISFDLSGRASEASLANDAGLPGLRGCIESAAHGITIRDVDTGDGSATVALTFSPR